MGTKVIIVESYSQLDNAERHLDTPLWIIVWKGSQSWCKTKERARC